MSIQRCATVNDQPAEWWLHCDGPECFAAATVRISGHVHAPEVARCRGDLVRAGWTVPDVPTAAPWRGSVKCPKHA